MSERMRGNGATDPNSVNPVGEEMQNCPFAKDCAVPSTPWGNVGTPEHHVCFKETAGKVDGCNRVLAALDEVISAKKVRQEMGVVAKQFSNPESAIKLLDNYVRAVGNELDNLLSCGKFSIEEMAAAKEASHSRLATLQGMCRRILETSDHNHVRQSEVLSVFFHSVQEFFDNKVRYSFNSPIPADNSELKRQQRHERGGPKRPVADTANPTLRALAIYAQCSLLDIPAEIYNQHPNGERIPLRKIAPVNEEAHVGPLVKLIVADQKLLVEVDGNLPANGD